MYSFTPLERARMAAMPMMPMEPAKAVMAVRPFLVMRFLKERPRAVRKDMDVRRGGLASLRGAVAGSKGLESLVMRPSARRTMRVA